MLAASLAAAPTTAEETGADDLSTLLGHFARSRGVEARFREEKHLPLLERPLVSEGVLYYAPPGRLARFTVHPEDASLLVDGDRLRIEDGLGVEEIDLAGQASARQFVDQLMLLFRGDREALLRDYEARFETSGGLESGTWSLSLAPRGLRMRQVIREISLRGSARRLDEMVVTGAAGELTRTTFGETRVDRPYRDDELALLFPAEGSPVALGRPTQP